MISNQLLVFLFVPSCLRSMVTFDSGFVLDAVLGFGLGALGLVPFLHTNTILAAFSDASPLLVVVLAFSHLAFESLPGVFFGVPTESQGVSALPGHALVRSGRGRMALEAVLSGLLGGLAGAVLLVPLFWYFGPVFFALVRPWTAWLLACVVVVALVVDGARPSHAAAFLAFGFFGVVAFGLPLREPLFPLLAGLFGMPAVFFMGRLHASSGPPGRFASAGLVALGSVLGGVSVFLPALSPSFLSALAFLFLPVNPIAALVVSSAVSSSRLVFDFLGVLVLHTARSAPAAAWRQSHVLGDGWILLVVGLAAFVLAWLAVAASWRRWLQAAASVPFSALGVALLAVVASGAWALDGSWGLFLLAWAATASVLAQRLHVPRKYALGCLMVPAMQYAWAV